MNEGAATQLDEILRALADATRRRIVRLLSTQPGLTTSQIASRTPNMSRWGVMKHLSVLRDAGLVHSLEEGRHRRHYRDGAPLELLRRWLEEEDESGAAGTGLSQLIRRPSRSVRSSTRPAD